MPGCEVKNNETNILTMISVPAAFAKQGYMAKRVQEPNPTLTLHVQRQFPVRVIILITECFRAS